MSLGLWRGVELATGSQWSGGLPPSGQDDMLIDIVPGIAATTSSAASTTAAQEATRLTVVITTSYSAGATMSVGNAANPTLLLSAFDLTQVPDTYVLPVLTLFGAAQPILVTIAGAPAAGASRVSVIYGSPQS